MIRLLNLSLYLMYIVITDGELSRKDYKYYYDAMGWLKIHLTPASWRDARNTCVDEGAMLASPDTQKMAAAMATTILTSSLPPVYVYTGIHDTYCKGMFHSAQGTPLSKIWASWAPGEPNNVENDESCLIMHRNGQLYDNACTDMFPFICYRPEIVTGASSCGTEDIGYTYEQRTGSCYKFHLVPQTWSQAFGQCSREGGHLLVINSDLEAQVITELFEYFRATDIALIGFTDTGNGTSSNKITTWITVHGQTLKDAGYERWAEGEPQHDGTHCGAVFEDGLLDDYFCDMAMPFICEMTQPKPRVVGSHNIH